MKFIVDKKIPFLQGVLEAYGEVLYREGRDISHDDVRDADALIIRTRTRCDKELLEGTRVRFIATATIGFDHIDTAYCDAHGITWTNAAGCNSSSVQQYIAAVLIHLAEQFDYNLAQKTIGIVGVGSVGSKVEHLCRTLGMKVLLNDPPRERREGKGNFVSLETLAAQADILTFHVPLNKEGEDKTWHLVDGGFLADLRNDQVIINTSRGEVIDSDALRATLIERKLAAAVLDVWEQEPDIDKELLGRVQIGTPHIAGYSTDGKANGTAMSVQAFSRFFGYDLHDWYPPRVPLPASTMMEVDCTGMGEQDVLGTLIHRTYDILADDARLRMSPQSFERQRGEYPLRREFPVYSARLIHASERARTLVRHIGFQLTE